MPSSYCTEFFFRLRLQEYSSNITMSTIQDLLPDHHALKEHLVIDVCFKVGKRHRKETIPFPNDIKELLDNYLPYEFDTPSGFHLYGLLRNPINGTVHAFIDSDERDRVLEIYKQRAEQITEEEVLDDGTEWRAPRSLRESRFKKYPNPSEEYIKKPVIFHNAIETNRRKH